MPPSSEPTGPLEKPSDKTPPPTVRSVPAADKQPVKPEPTPIRSPTRQAPGPPPPKQVLLQEPAQEPIATATKEAANNKGKRKSFFKFGSKK